MAVVLMFVGALVVASGGIVAKAFTNAGVLPEVAPERAFFLAAELLSHPGIFGLILAALTAALMSTVDTLITAVSAVAVNDLYQPYIRPDADERQLLRTARIVAIAATIFGVLMVPVFQQFKTIYQAHGAFTAAVTPPMVIALLFSVFWRRFSRPAALSVLIGGFVCILISLFIPEIVKPFAHGVPMGERGDGIFGGASQQVFMRAFYGGVVCVVIGSIVTFLTRPEPEERQRGLVWGTINDALEHYKGSPGREADVVKAFAQPKILEKSLPGARDMTGVSISSKTAEELQARLGDLVYVSDTRWWTGGLYSTHAIVSKIEE